MASIRRVGYKPQIVCDLLGIGFQTFRYWRKRIEPWPRRAFFSAGDLLAFRIIKTLIYRKHLTIDFLSSFSASTIFSVCAQQDLSTLSNQYLLLDESDHSLHFLPLNKKVDAYNLDLHVLQLGPVVVEHQNAFLKLGNHLLDSTTNTLRQMH